MLSSRSKLRPFCIATCIGICLLLLQTALLWSGGADQNKAPVTRKDNIKEVLHGVEIVDPYRWLEDQQAPETREWIKAQNEYTETLLAGFSGKERLKQRLTELMKVDVVGMPVQRGGRYFFTKRLADQDLDVIYMREGVDGQDKVLIDPHGMSDDHRTSVNIQDISDDGSLLVYGIRQGGEDEIQVRILDVTTRETLADELPKARYFGISLTPDKQAMYYTRHGAEGSRIFFRKLGAPADSDTELFGKGYGPGNIIFASLSDDGRYLLIHVLHGSAGRTEIHLKDLFKDGEAVTIVDELEARTFGQFAGKRVFLQTDWEAPNKRILSFDLNNLPTERAQWTEVIPESEAILTGFSVAGGKLCVNYLENVLSKVKVFNPDGSLVREISFPAIGSVGGVNGRWNQKEAFFSYSSFHIPQTIYRYDLDSAQMDIWTKLDLPLNADNIEVKQVWYESKDKTKVPMFLVHAKGLELDGTNPTYLTGYGGFSVSRTPSFSSTAALWSELGGVYALPNLRGGGEFGEKWHKAGMLENKQNVFDDFIAAAEWLVEQNYTSPSKLAIAGGSNGGLLVGAALTQRPDLFQAVLCAVPLLDMLRYQNFLVARFWTPEYGSSENAEHLNFLHAYSPYHNVQKGTDYPAVLLTTGDADTRVDPLHARKMTALLQEATASDRPISLYYDTKSGHSGGKPVSRQIEDSTVQYSFLLWQLGESLDYLDTSKK